MGNMQSSNGGAVMLSMWSPDSGQIWGAEGNENHGTISLADFLAANSGEENEDVRAQVLALKPGEMVAFGGGASPYCEVTLLCSCGGFTRDAHGSHAGEHLLGCTEFRRLNSQREANDNVNRTLERWRQR